jgi:hypothetical protein
MGRPVRLMFESRKNPTEIDSFSSLSIRIGPCDEEVKKEEEEREKSNRTVRRCVDRRTGTLHWKRAPARVHGSGGFVADRSNVACEEGSPRRIGDANGVVRSSIRRCGRSEGSVTVYQIDKTVAGGSARQQEPRTKASPGTRLQHETWRDNGPAASVVDQVLDDSFPASDPPSWTGSISRVASPPERPPAHEQVVRRIRAEFLEMPGLCLTLEQAQRLWSLKPRACAAILNSLVDARFLRRTDRGLFVLHTRRD